MTVERKTAEPKATDRRTNILLAARWCFLNFGFAKTSLEDIAKRATLSRTLLYRLFKDKEEIFAAVFEHWLLARHPEAWQAVNGPGTPCERLLSVCRVMVLDPWSEMVGAPMGNEFFHVCERLAPPFEDCHRKALFQCVTAILGNEEHAKVFLLCIEGLLTDRPTVAALEARLQIIAERFVPSTETSRPL